MKRPLTLADFVTKVTCELKLAARTRVAPCRDVYFCSSCGASIFAKVGERPQCAVSVLLCKTVPPPNLPVQSPRK